MGDRVNAERLKMSTAAVGEPGAWPDTEYDPQYLADMKELRTLMDGLLDWRELQATTPAEREAAGREAQARIKDFQRELKQRAEGVQQ